MFRLLSLLLFSLLTFSTFAQQSDLKNEQRIEELVETMAVSDESGNVNSLILDDLNHYGNQPLFINKASEEELMVFHFFNFRQVKEIISYRKKYGRIYTLKELMVKGDFPSELLKRIEPYIRFDQDPDSIEQRNAGRIHQSLLFRVKTNLPVPVGYSASGNKSSAYRGSPLGYYSTYRGSLGNSVDWGITGENDAGEDFFSRSNRLGFDFLSGYASFHGKGMVKKIILGDFHLRFGQGVNLWSGGGSSYSSDLSTLMLSGEGIRTSGSSDENLYFRGLASQLDLNRMKLSLYFSDKQLDANVLSDSTGNRVISSFRMDGLHRTDSELKDENNINERLWGGYMDFRFEQWRFGILMAGRKFSLPVVKGDAPYKSKSFEGDVNLNGGLDYQLILNKISLFGELGISGSRKIAFVNGLVWKANQQFSLAILYRNYDPGFFSFNSNAYAAGSGCRNEKGTCTSFECFPAAKVKISGQADRFYFPWTTFRTISPAGGSAISFRTDLTLNSGLLCYFQVRINSFPQKVSGSTGVPEQYTEKTSKWRLHGDWQVNEHIQVRSRFEYITYHYNQKRENGYLFFQDLIGTVGPSLKCWFRLAFYNTDGYNSRVYCYENDLLNYYAIPEFHGLGIRSYLNLKFQPQRFLTTYFKIGYTLRRGVEEMGSGNDASPGNHRFDVRCQFMLKF